MPAKLTRSVLIACIPAWQKVASTLILTPYLTLRKIDSKPPQRIDAKRWLGVGRARLPSKLLPVTRLRRIGVLMPGPGEPNGHI